jgi:hypothetical protein
VALAAILGAGCAALAWTHARRVAQVTGAEVSALVVALKKLPEAERLDALARRSRPGSVERRMASLALAEGGDRAKIAVVNDVLAEVEHSLERSAGWPSAALRIALFGAMLLAVVAYLTAQEIRWALAIVGIGGVAALACVEANRAAKRGAEAQRQVIDALVATALGHLVDGAPEPPRRRSRRRSNRG